MKRLTAFFIAVLMLMSFTSLLVSAETAEDSQDDSVIREALGSGAVNFTCNYSEDAKKIEIRGTVNYNVLVSYGKYKIEILRIAPNQTAEDALLAEEPDIAADMDIAARFDISFELNSSVEKFFKYAIVLCSPDNERILASDSKYVLVPSSFSHLADKKAFKGISPLNISELSVSGDMGFGSAVIPVYYDRLINESQNGYIYPHEDTHCYFDKTYIDELDMKIRTYSATGARVYLQLLMVPNTSSTALNSAAAQSSAESLMPDVYDWSNASKISTYVRFLASRYDNYGSGIISGIIVGKQVDREKYNYNGGLDLSTYASKYAFYLTVVANSARLENPNMDIVVPISNFNSYGTDMGQAMEGYAPSELLDGIFASLDKAFVDGMSCSVMIENDTSPIRLVEGDGEDGIYAPAEEKEDRIGLNNFILFERYFYGLGERYRSAPKSYIYYWNIPEDIDGNMLECAYAYSYYMLLGKADISSFVVSFSKTSSRAIQTVSKLLNNIDTVNGSAETKRLLEFFGVAEWKELVSVHTDNGYILRNEYSQVNKSVWNNQWKGSFSYFDFSTGGIRDWYSGAYGKALRTDYGAEGRRALHQTVGRGSGAEHSDLLCLYEFDENFIYTPALKFIVEITDSEDSVGAVYELTVTVGTGTSFITESYVVSSGQRVDLWLDMSQYNEKNKASYIKLSTRSISGGYDEYSLWLYDVMGYSTEYDDERLGELITAERFNIRNQSHTQDGTRSDNIIYWIVFAIALVAICIGGLMFMLIRRDDSFTRKNRAKKNK